MSFSWLHRVVAHHRARTFLSLLVMAGFCMARDWSHAAPALVPETAPPSPPPPSSPSPNPVLQSPILPDALPESPITLATAPIADDLGHQTRLKAQNEAMVAGLQGQLHQQLLPASPYLGNRSVTAWVYLPPGYDASSERYPVAYLLHGAPGEAREWFVNAKAQRVVEQLLSRRRIAPMILVAFDGFGPNGFKDDQDYLDRADGTFQMESFITNALVPWVDTHFRTLPNANARALIGFSAGGYGAANLGLKHPDIWQVMASIAGFFDAGDDPENMTRLLGPKSLLWDVNSPLLRVRELPRGARLHFHMDCGRDDSLFHEFRKMTHELKARHVDYETQALEGDHSWDYVHDRLFTVMQFCDRRWREMGARAGQ